MYVCVLFLSVYCWNESVYIQVLYATYQMYPSISDTFPIKPFKSSNHLSYSVLIILRFHRYPFTIFMKEDNLNAEEEELSLYSSFYLHMMFDDKSSQIILD